MLPLGHVPVRSVGLFFLATAFAQAQISTSAYRVLGQPDLHQNSVNMVLGVELNAPSGIAIDGRGGQVHVYVSDTRNSRVLAWQDARSYQIGDPPSLVLGQPGPQYSRPLGIGLKGFNAPLGLAVDAGTGNLYVADFGNNRVLRFPAPFANPTRVEPDAVYGQPSFTSNSPGASASLLNKPRSVAVDGGGNLWVADTGNHRVVRFSAATLDSPTPPSADTVIGQKDFLSSSANRGSGGVTASGFDTPTGLAFDAQGNLYVADFNNTRVLKFSSPLGPNAADPAASAVIGQSNFTTRAIPLQPSNSTLAGPTGVSVDGSGSLYVAVPSDNRVLVFSTATIASGAQNVLGQANFSANTANAGVFPQASPNTLSGPADVKLDPNGNVYVADAGNNRVLLFPSGSKTATMAWGQSSFSANGPNQIKPTSLNSPAMMAIDYSQEPYALYISDSANHRILVWKDSVQFRNGDPADFAIGQPDLRSGFANVDTRGSSSPSSTSLSSPQGIVVQQDTGILFVADSGNNRILRFPRPVSQVGRITPDAVIGQVDFTSSVSAAISASSLKAPSGLAFGPDGDLFVADTGNNRVVEFGAGNQLAAIRVYGQPSFTSGVAPAQVSAQTLIAPQGIFVDAAFNLYVADTGANRVVIFPNTQAAPSGGMAAAFVIGQTRFDSTSGGSTVLRGPTDLAVDLSGNIYVADAGNNRVLEFPSLLFLPVADAVPFAVIGQRDINGSGPNWNSQDGLATPEGLFGPVGVYLDRQDTLYVADAGNSRLVHFLKAMNAVHAATLQSGVPVAQGGLVALLGAGFANDNAAADGTPWPTSLVNRQVVVNDQTLASLHSVTPTQVNFQFPSAAPVGSDRIAVRQADTGELIAGGSILAAATSPGLYTVSGSGAGQAVAFNQDNTANSSSNPAAVGSVITLYGTGQGQVSPSVPDGMEAPSGPQATTVAVPTSDGKACLTSQPSMCVAIGSTFGEVQYSGLAAGSVGKWQISLKIPQGTASGNAVPVRVLINGVPSNTVTVAIR
jgi:uncharacterized protein (TIGR03437 family)